MRLLNASTLKLHDFLGSNIPRYAILSHRWEDAEVTFQDLRHGRPRRMAGWSKVVGCCAQAIIDGWEYVWIDSCCIDKSSSAELSEAINSMYMWYQQAEVCYTYLSDVSSIDAPHLVDSTFGKSKWFTRGWTLQELLAPYYIDFFDCSWTWIGSKSSLEEVIRQRTGILDIWNYQSSSVAQKMSWASSRETTRTEDQAYCLLGLFGVHLPPLYGEGENAFIRLQLEILSKTDDDSIFAWEGEGGGPYGLLAPSPKNFINSSHFVKTVFDPDRPPHSLTNRGLYMPFKLVRRSDSRSGDVKRQVVIAPLNCRQMKDDEEGQSNNVVALILYPNVHGQNWWRDYCLEIHKISSKRGPKVEEIERTVLCVPLIHDLLPLSTKLKTHIRLDAHSLEAAPVSLIAAQTSIQGTMKAYWGQNQDHSHILYRFEDEGSRAAIIFDTASDRKRVWPLFSIVLGISKGRCWIDVRLRPPWVEPPLLVNKVLAGQDRVSRPFPPHGALNARLKNGANNLEVIVEVTLDPKGKLRWPGS